MDRLFFLLGVFSVTLIMLVLVSIRRAHIRVEYSVSWLTAGLALFLLSLNQGFVRWLAVFFNIDYPSIIVLAMVVGVFLIVIYRLSIRVSALKDANIALAQRVAILEYYVKSRDEDTQTAKNV
jgi:hypothetical protein